MKTTQGARQANRDAAYAQRTCKNKGCGHPRYVHLEAVRDSPRYRPLRFFCRTDGCQCFYDVGAGR